MTRTLAEAQHRQLARNEREIRGVLDGGTLQFLNDDEWIDMGGDIDTWLVMLVASVGRDNTYRIKPGTAPVEAPQRAAGEVAVPVAIQRDVIYRMAVDSGLIEKDLGSSENWMSDYGSCEDEVMAFAGMVRAHPPSGDPAPQPPLAQGMPAGEWQPIATAPKGRKVLAGYWNKLKKWRTVTARYYLPQTLQMEDDRDDLDDDGYAPEGWYEESETQDGILPTDEPPTHWMPLPAEPAKNGIALKTPNAEQGDRHG